MERRIYEQGLEEFPKSSIGLGNFFMVLWIGLGTAGCWFVSPVLAFVYLLSAVLMVGVILRKMLCTDCYYYGKWCPVGWGKLASIFFTKGSIGNFSKGSGMKLAPLTYGLLALVPVVLIIVSSVQSFSVSKIIVLVLILAVSFYSGAVVRKRSCSRCKMRLLCPGSAVKG